MTKGIEQSPSIISNNTTTTTTTRSNSRKMVGVGRSTNNGSMGGTIGTKPTLVEVGTKLRFLIMDAPRQGNLHLYIKEMRKYSVTDIVRACEPTYQTGELTTAGIATHNMEYPDGHSPPQDIIDQWLHVVDKVFYPEKKDEQAADEKTRPCIAVHCVAGLGRAPVMVAIALIEFENMDPVEAVTLIRRHRRGAINEKQLLYLEGYKKYYRKKNGGGAEAGCCIIS
jgi:protein tyrosine phosphatase type 4A